jgi:L-ascorbate metabolism protein UlaG (beta-lactamase superfamily)
MQIIWHGLSCFEIETKTVNGTATLVIDPYNGTTGLRFPRAIEADIVLSSHNEEDANNVGAINGQPFVIDTPGEFEVRDVFVFGLATTVERSSKEKGSSSTDNILFRVEAEQMRVAHLGAINRALTDAELAQLENIDLLMIPVGGGRVMSSKIATEVITQIEPRVVIPMTHALPGMKETLDTVEKFCKELGSCRRETVNKYKVTRKDLPEDDMLIVTLGR